MHLSGVVKNVIEVDLNNIFFKVLEGTEDQDDTILDIPDAEADVLQSLLDIIYNGSIEASLDMIRRLLVLAHSLYISVPVSEQLITMLGLELPPQPPLPSTAAHSKTNMEIPGMPQKSFQSHSMR